MEIMIRSKSV